jgi:hypothetical protein
MHGIDPLMHTTRLTWYVCYKPLKAWDFICQHSIYVTLTSCFIAYCVQVCGDREIIGDVWGGVGGMDCIKNAAPPSLRKIRHDCTVRLECTSPVTAGSIILVFHWLALCAFAWADKKIFKEICTTDSVS